MSGEAGPREVIAPCRKSVYGTRAMASFIGLLLTLWLLQVKRDVANKDPEHLSAVLEERATLAFTPRVKMSAAIFKNTCHLR